MRARATGSLGQSLVEFALTLPIMVVLLMGVIDVGFILHAHVQTAGACWEGARRGTLYGGNLNSSYDQNDTERAQVVRAAVQGAMGRLDVSDAQNFSAASDVQITYYPDIPAADSTRSGEEMMVRCSYRQPVWFGVLTGISNHRLSVSSSTRVRIQ